MNMQDIKLIDHGEYYDFRITDDGNIEAEESFDSALITSLFVEKRASADEVPIPQARRGWIGTVGQKHKLGSKLWLYSQIRATEIDTQRIRSEVIAATQHFVDDGLVKSITAEVTLEDGVLAFILTIFRYNSKVDTRYFELWNNTGE